MAVVVPTLTLAGYIKDEPSIMKQMLSYALTSNYSQSTLFLGKITSIPYIISRSYQDKSQLINELQEALYSYYQRAFKTVEVEVSQSPITNSDNFNIRIYLSAIGSAGKRFNLASLARVDNGALKDILFELNR